MLRSRRFTLVPDGDGWCIRSEHRDAEPLRFDTMDAAREYFRSHLRRDDTVLRVMSAPDEKNTSTTRAADGIARFNNATGSAGAERKSDCTDTTVHHG